MQSKHQGQREGEAIKLKKKVLTEVCIQKVCNSPGHLWVTEAHKYFPAVWSSGEFVLVPFLENLYNPILKRKIHTNLGFEEPPSPPQVA